MTAIATKPPRWSPEVIDRVRALHAAGTCDRLIRDGMADVFAPGRAGRFQVNGIRRVVLGLPLNPDPFAAGDQQRRETVALSGAARWGLPADLAPRQVQMILALTAGPMTTEQVLVAAGMSARTAAGYVNHPTTWVRGRKVAYLPDLIARGLVVRIDGSGWHAQSRYVLTADCLERLRASVERQMQTRGDAMPTVPEDQIKDAMAVVRWEAQSVRHVPPGVDLDDLESVGNEALAKAVAEYDPACGLEFKTFAKYAAKRAMENFVKAARRRKGHEGHFAADPETGEQFIPADARSPAPDRMAEVGELLSDDRPVPAKKQQYITVSRVEATTPEAAEVGRRVAEYQSALHAALTPTDVGDVVKAVVKRARKGNLQAAKIVIDLATPAKAGVVVQTATIVRPSDLE